MIYLACIVYATAMIVANAIVGAYGPWVSPINAFILIGLELSLRDWLHFHLTRIGMVLLILTSGVLTWVLNAAPAQIAIASSVAFMAAAFADWATFAGLKSRPWLIRANGSNVAGAAVDSILFPTIAFGVLPHIIILQFGAKVLGGALWSFLLAPKRVTQ